MINVKWIIREEKCQLCENPGNKTTPFYHNWSQIDICKGYIFCNECKEKGNKYFSKINEDCRSLISKETERSFDDFDFAKIGVYLKDKKLKCLSDGEIIESSFEGSGCSSENNEFYVMLTYKPDEKTYCFRRVLFKEFLKLNKDWF